MNNNDQDIELIKQTNTLSNDQQTTKKIIENQQSERINEEEINSIIENPNQMENVFKSSHNDSSPTRSSETSQVNLNPTSVSLQVKTKFLFINYYHFNRTYFSKNLLCYQDVMNAIEREFHLHAGQEREIIMKLWLKGQTMISILQRFRYLLQDLNIDDKDFTLALKVCSD